MTSLIARALELRRRAASATPVSPAVPQRPAGDPFFEWASGGCPSSALDLSRPELTAKVCLAFYRAAEHTLKNEGQQGELSEIGRSEEFKVSRLLTWVGGQLCGITSVRLGDQERADEALAAVLKVYPAVPTPGGLVLDALAMPFTGYWSGSFYSLQAFLGRSSKLPNGEYLPEAGLFCSLLQMLKTSLVETRPQPFSTELATGRVQHATALRAKQLNLRSPDDVRRLVLASRPSVGAPVVEAQPMSSEQLAPTKDWSW